MEKEHVFSQIVYKILQSNEFKIHLEKINTLYSNLKQEFHIRNFILEVLNTKYLGLSDYINYLAFAEHPRGEKGRRVDLSIVKKNEKNIKPFLIEFKFQYPKDFILFDYQHTIERDFGSIKIEGQKTNLFILIVSSWKKEDKKAFDNIWNIDSNLSRYQLSQKQNDELWKTRLKEAFSFFSKSGNLKNIILHQIKKPYPVEYYIYFLTREST